MRYLLILLLVVGCESPTEGDTSSNEVDIDWMLIEATEFGDLDLGQTPSNGYFLVFIDSTITLTNPTYVQEPDENDPGDYISFWSFVDNESPTLSFIYNNENFNIPLNYISETYTFSASQNEGFGRIIYNQTMSYLTIFYLEGYSNSIDISTFEVIDYR